MKVFRVRVERDRDGSLIKEPGKTSVEVEQLDYYYAARCIGDVWAYTEFMRLNQDLSFIGIAETLPAIHVIEGAPY